MDPGPVIIEFQSFLSTLPIEDERLRAIAKGLQAQYACFKEDVKKHYNHHASKGKHNNSLEKPRIGLRELSREAIARKDFLAMINKLSPQNLDTMKEHCKSVLRPECIPLYVDMLWDAMLRSPEYQHLYVDIMLTIDKVQSVFADVHRIWDSFVEKKAWMVDTNTATDASYDDFCDHVKTKKRAIASVRGWIHLTQEKLCDPSITDKLLQLLLQDPPTDVSVEQLIELYKSCPVQFKIAIPTIREWHENAANLAPIVRFKLMDLWEILSKI